MSERPSAPAAPRPPGPPPPRAMPSLPPARPHHTNGALPVHRPPAPGLQGGGPLDDGDKGLKMKIKRTKSGRQEIVAMAGAEGEGSEGERSRDSSSSPARSAGPRPCSPPSPGAAGGTNGGPRLPRRGGKADMRDAATDTREATTSTEPESLGPCEPGTEVRLEGIVWHETDNGVLVVNVTWRGKTYVGTLMDNTRHPGVWSAPRFTDSPEPGGKGGRGKRGRQSGAGETLEPRKNLRSSKAKGKGGGKGVKGVKEDEFNFPAPCSPAKDSGKRKGRPDDLEEAKKRKKNAGSDQEDDKTEETEEEEEKDDATPPPPPPPARREPRVEVYSYRMQQCPRKDCSKQYKEEEGLRWHLSHSHPEYIDPQGQIKDAATVEREQEERKKRARARREGKAGEERGAGAAPLPKTPKLEPGTAKASTPGRPSSRPAAGGPAPPVGSSARRPGELPAGLVKPVKVAEGTASPTTLVPAMPLLEELKRRAVDGVSPDPGSPLASQEKPPANSPAQYSDISDDGEDSRGSREPASAPAPRPAGPPPVTVPHTPLLAPPRALPQHPSRLPSPGGHRPSTPSSYPRTSTPSSYSTSTPTRPTSRPSPSLISPSCGPNPGTPEYHKYLAANGFPPFPYPYPVGMDPSYHIQLLQTDHMYKMKWEKDRAEREKAFKDQLDRDQGKFSGLSLIKEEKLSGSSPVSRAAKAGGQEEVRRREASGGSGRGGALGASLISVKAEFREKDDVKREVKLEDQGVKPTMETRGPPPGPQTFGYMHPSLLRPGVPPFSMHSGMAGLPPPHFDPMMAQAMMGSPSPYGLPPYLTPGHMAMGPRPPQPFSFPGDPLRSPFTGLPSAEEMARVGAMSGGGPGLSGTKALDLLQQHASQYYANQKLAELQERALKSPSSSISSGASLTASPVLQASKPVTTVAGKDSATPTASLSGPEKAKSPPPLRHVHTHTHTHIGLGYPLLPGVPGGVPAGPPGALPPPTVGVSGQLAGSLGPPGPGGPPFPAPGPYPGKSP